MLVDGCWDACSNQRMEVDSWDGRWNACSSRREEGRWVLAVAEKLVATKKG
ncbi:hypothetical protein Pyn_33724 [Prunus yedoensis var. nudiflora]|uniref:Uncharacterized protein n=1 Tax=Prunus yedoensis var. nudiflora TaxID=2094558 RepID=A0A314XLP5_PRUYE|nr:hypothetical protein Pyn_33724 [Prunus yedoensis var. nudiflora]